MIRIDSETTCTRCRLHRTRKNIVRPRGPTPADFVIVGEGPGGVEDEEGSPFVGKSGAFLDEVCAEVGFPLGLVRIMNLIRCRPPGNADPTPEQVATCRRWFRRDLAEARPRVIVLLGRFAAHYLAGVDLRAKIKKYRGTWWFMEESCIDIGTLPQDHHVQLVREKRYPDRVLIFSMYHPAHIVRQPYSPQALEFKADFRTLRNIGQRLGVLIG